MGRESFQQHSRCLAVRTGQETKVQAAPGEEADCASCSRTRFVASCGGRHGLSFLSHRSSARSICGCAVSDEGVSSLPDRGCGSHAARARPVGFYGGAGQEGGRVLALGCSGPSMRQSHCLSGRYSFCSLGGHAAKAQAS